MHKVIMVREKIYKSKEYLIDPKDRDTELKEIWSNEECDPFWNEYYRVGIYDDEEYEDEHQALCEEGNHFYDFDEAYKYYKYLEHNLKISEELDHLDKKELSALVNAYNDYVRHFDEHPDEGKPVGLAEFYEHDWQDYFKERYMKGE